ncbi:heme ABC exporter ATP-binding protein CcmA [Pseudonocardia sp.]|uniref:heme ABC exporter ATP-binding protein CcmA n=1 Tax=Pseudonocardia sp. TaxID=60912 RepID=UPI0026255C5B|nr:heme ABC exporter ATP-binding protein CcmA [Pseudonocardia sp.]MCW2717976.1 transporter ATP-binding protein [Pseudonocardia sp.]MDT7618595.1 type transport system ATP-binding protein [Pseudonocardiales bacterium]
MAENVPKKPGQKPVRTSPRQSASGKAAPGRRASGRKAPGKIAPEKAVLDVRDLSKAFGGQAVLDRVSVRVPAGRAVGVVGPNGAGKTTLLRCVVGIEVPDSGTVLLDGEQRPETDPRFRADVAVLVDDLDVFGDLSVLEHLDLLACAHGVPNSRAVVDAVLADVRLTASADHLPATLSSGQRRRLALASLLVRPRRLLVLDEPEQRLDTAGRAWLVERLTAEKAAGTALLFACHDDEILQAVADDVVRIGE